MERLEAPHFSFVNCYHVPGHFDRKRVDRVFLLSALIEHGGPVLALGGEVSHALKKIGHPHYRLHHPSYRNRVLNDRRVEDEMINRAREFLENFP